MKRNSGITFYFFLRKLILLVESILIQKEDAASLLFNERSQIFILHNLMQKLKGNDELKYCCQNLNVKHIQDFMLSTIHL